MDGNTDFQRRYDCGDTPFFESERGSIIGLERLAKALRRDFPEYEHSVVQGAGA